MSIAANQQRTLLTLLTQLRPHWRRDRNLPARIQTLLSRNRSFGSRDRRLYRELIYTTLRFLPWIEPRLDRQPEFAASSIAWLAADSPATETFRRTLIADWPACPPSVAEKATVLNGASQSRAAIAETEPVFQPDDLLPAWLKAECPEAFEAAQLDALHTRAPLWLRVKKETVQQVTAEFDQLGWRWKPDRALPTAIQVMDEIDVTKSAAFGSGLFEVQDVGSQLLLESAAIRPTEKWLDACAGAGGKTLQLAELLGSSGQVDAFDIRRSALAELSTRAARARIRTISILEHRPTAEYDGVFVDAPCTGSGTWRRAPHLKWSTTAQQIADAAEVQKTLLTEFSQRVRPGGQLLYATCSLNRSENEAVVAGFLTAQPEFTSKLPPHDFGATARGGGLTFPPALRNSDGFFIAMFTRRG